MKTYQCICKCCSQSFGHARWGKKLCSVCHEKELERKRRAPNFGSRKKKKYLFNCSECNQKFNHADVKAKICDECREK